jgi:hypothetical protein
MRFKTLIQLLDQPYPYAADLKGRWQMSFVFSVFVFLFLYGFAPFGLGQAPYPLVYLAAAYGLLCFVFMVFLNIVLVVLMPGWFQENEWTTRRQIGWTLVNMLLIGAGNAVLTMLLFDWPFSWRQLLVLEAYTLAIGLFPVSLSLILNQMRLERIYRKQAEIYNHTLPHYTRNVVSEQVSLVSDNQDEDLQLALDELLFIQAADNYVAVHWQRQGENEKRLLRAPLKRMEAALSAYPNVWKCHKSYLVNLNRVVQIIGNAQGYRLLLDVGEYSIPVSRQNNEALKKWDAIRPNK